jgi:hypothetical protein
MTTNGIAVGQILTPIDGKKDTPVNGPLQFILPLARVEVVNIRGTFVTVTIPGLAGEFYLEAMDLAGWKTVSSNAAANIDWLVTGAKLVDLKGQRYLVSAVMGTEVVLRKTSVDRGTTHLEGLVRMPIDVALETLSPEKNSSSTTSIREEGANVSYSGLVRGGVLVRDRDTGEDYIIRDIVLARNMCRLQPITWVHPEVGGNGIYKTSPTWIGAELEVMDEKFEIQDKGGYPRDHSTCPQCKERGDFHRVLSPTRFYQCPNKHEWSYIYDQNRKGQLTKNRFTLLSED